MVYDSSKLARMVPPQTEQSPPVMNEQCDRVLRALEADISSAGERRASTSPPLADDDPVYGAPKPGEDLWVASVSGGGKRAANGGGAEKANPRGEDARPTKTLGGERRRQKSLRIGVHHANAVVWGPVCPTGGGEDDDSNRRR